MKDKGCKVQLNSVDARAYIPPPGRTPHAPNVKVDPIAKAIAMEILSKNLEQCINSDGSLNHEGFNAAAKAHLNSGNQRAPVARIKDHLKRR